MALQGAGRGSCRYQICWARWAGARAGAGWMREHVRRWSGWRSAPRPWSPRCPPPSVPASSARPGDGSFARNQYLLWEVRQEMHTFTQEPLDTRPHILHCLLALTLMLLCLAARQFIKAGSLHKPSTWRSC